MSALLESLVAGFASDASGHATLDAVVREGLPNPRSEAWKYTSLRALERRTFAPATPAPAIDDSLLASIPAPRLVFVNGSFDAMLSDLRELPAGVELHAGVFATAPVALSTHADDVFARLNDAMATNGTTMRVGAGIDAGTPVHLVFVGAPAGADQAWHLRHRIMLGTQSRLTVVEHHLATGDHAHLANAVTRIELSANAHLVHVRLQTEASAATCVLRTDAELAANARYERMDLELGAALSRHDLNVRLSGEGASLLANGVQLAHGRRHVDTRLGIEHVGRDTTCKLTWRGLGAGRGRVVFRGGITIKAGADGSDALLSSRNVLLSDSAEIDTQPVLEIHADEVKAAHGATVGQLDPQAIFYLRSRGLPCDEARRLLTAAFCREPLGCIRDDALRAGLVEKLDGALTGLPAA